MQGIAATPNPWEFSITPRSEQHARIIRRKYADTIPMFLPYEHRLSQEDKDWLLKTRQQDRLLH
jgi:hypothetical protein